MPLDLSSFPLYLFQASQERAWTAAEIDYSREGEHWASLNDDEQTLLGRLIAGFRLGERGVTHELAPLLAVVRDEKRLDEELYITAQIFEEARHVEFFERWLQAALPGVWGVDLPYPELRGDLFGAHLPEVMRSLNDDRSLRNQLRAVMMYHFYIEGIGAESAYPLFFSVFEKTGLFPALAEGIRLIRRDEARHIAFGTYYLQRLLEENSELKEAFEEECSVIETYLDSSGRDPFEPFEGRNVPFGLEPGKFTGLYRECYRLQKRNVYERTQPVGV
jgi:ribonucleoside-diphosphate reductase beta chain